ncbi:MAG: hypothetical protein ABH804_00400 [archaeon]
MKKNNFKKIKPSILICAVVQIFLLINLMTAQNYFLSKTYDDKTEANNQDIFSKKILGVFLKIISIKQIKTVSAYWVPSGFCCPKTEDGELCRTLKSEDINYVNCSYELILGSCEEVFCLKCCPRTKNGEICKNTILPEKDMCAENIVYGSCEAVNCKILNQFEGNSGEKIEIDASWNCCLKTKGGAICQDFLPTDEDKCETSVPTECSQVSECKLGCCIDDDEGLCTPRAPKQKCEDNGGKWDSEENCALEECQKGCCVLGEQASFVTEKRCEVLSLIFSTEKDFRKGESEFSCLLLAKSQAKGACVYDEGICKSLTEESCLGTGGRFYKNYLCSHPDLNTICERQSEVKCDDSENNFEIYWFDNCGNKENIYSSDKEKSWNNGMILKKEDSCNPDLSNIGSKTCGNCNYYLGSKCVQSDEENGKKVEDGNYICKNLNCIDDDGKEWKNGESWCEYDSYIGDGKDTVGSRHWIKTCTEGEIITRGCADYRGEICVQSKMEESEKEFSVASCVMNEATKCLEYNTRSNMAELCNENPYCMIKNIAISKYFKFDICVGEYPKGFDLRDSGQEQLCGLATQTCTVYYQKNWKGGWDCIANCECKTEAFVQQMNDFCISLGDCGSYINYIGEGTSSSKLNGADVPWSQYKEFANPVEGKYAVPRNISESSYALVGAGEPYVPEEGSEIEKTIELLGQISGASGLLIQGAGYFFPELIKTAAVEAGNSASLATATTLGAIGSAAVGAGIGMFAAKYLGELFGVKGDGLAVMTFAGGVSGAAAGYMIATQATTVGWVFFWGGIALMLYIIIIGWGETKEEKIEFKCMMWEAPLGGSDCKKCNENSEKPCTKYRCESLGQACKILNEEVVENPVCENIPYETNPPVITPGENITEEYKFQNEENKRVEIRKEDGSCIQEFTPILFELETDEYAQCKFSFEKKSDYENMGDNYPIEQNLFTLKHNFGFFMPSLESLEVYDVEGDLIEMFGKTDMYIKCQDSWGNKNLEEYIVNFCIHSGPDVTPVNHIYTTANPSDNIFLRYGTNETPMTLWVNEPAECKYDSSPNKEYNKMLYSMDCRTGLNQSQTNGWPCYTTLTNLKAGENKFYFKCKDQPWKSPEEQNLRNINSQDYEYTINIPEKILKINSIFPEGEIEKGFEPVPINLEVKTSEGSENGKSKCYYSFAGYGNIYEFFETRSNIHLQNFNLMRGSYKIYVKCTDDAGDSATGETSFKIKIDKSPPNVVNVYYENNKLKLKTDEDAECYYDFNTCNYNPANANRMTTAFSITHSAEWIPGKVYYIKCFDVWGNGGSGCSIEVAASSITK